jgi:hypothetical protein
LGLGPAARLIGYDRPRALGKVFDRIGIREPPVRGRIFGWVIAREIGRVTPPRKAGALALPLPRHMEAVYPPHPLRPERVSGKRCRDRRSDEASGPERRSSDESAWSRRCLDRRHHSGDAENADAGRKNSRDHHPYSLPTHSGRIGNKVSAFLTRRAKPRRWYFGGEVNRRACGAGSPAAARPAGSGRSCRPLARGR